MIARLLILLAIPVWTAHYRRLAPLTWQRALRYLLMCCAVFLLGLLARGDVMLGSLWLWACGASLFCMGLLILVIGVEL